MGGYAAWHEYPSIWVTWWLGDASGALVFAPLIITWAATGASLRGRWIEVSLLALALVGVTAFVFGGLYEPLRNYPLAFLCIPPVVWAAVRFGPRETSTAIAALSLLAAWNTHRGLGPFALVGSDNLVVLQAFMATVAIMTLAMSALVAERGRVEEERLRLLAAAQKARVDAEAATLAKDEFLAMLGHELRNPIGAIATAIHVLDRSVAFRGDAARARDVVRRQADHLTRLVDDLLDATRVATGKISLNRHPVDLASVTSRAVEALATAGRIGDHDLLLDVHSVFVNGDATRLEQVVSNLVGNALKYTPASGTIRVTVAQDNRRAILRVTDTGIGMVPELLPHIFDLFAQGERGLDRTEGGLGIGLTLVKHVVELHGGSIDARSEGAGCGSEFTVRLPMTSAAADSRVLAPAIRPVADRARTRRILVVEDQADMRDILRLALESAGHLVADAADGPSAVDADKRFGPEVALVDIGLPGFDGYEVARRIRAAHGHAPIVLIAVTGYGQPEDRRRAAAAGFDLHVVKPVDIDRLEQLLATWSPLSR